jgi:tetratricopeptide (TPR) repeat protein
LYILGRLQRWLYVALMTVSASTQIPKTTDSAVFQRQCKVLFEHVLKDPTVQEFGSSGQKQKGIDLLGRRRVVALDHWVGVQCKLAIKAERLKKGVVREEASQALSIEPPLREFILVTTAADDARLIAEAALVTDEQAKLGRDFTVQIWGWETLQTHILQYEQAIYAFSPDAFPHLRQLQKGQDKLVEQAARLESGQSIELSMLQNIQKSVDAIVVGVSSTVEASVVDTMLDRELDQYRNLLNQQPKTALSLLEDLWTRLPESVDGRIRFRVKANIAACRLRLGEDHSAGELYLEAHDFAPDEPKAPAFKVLGLILLGKPEEAYSFGLEARRKSAANAPLFAHLIMAAKLVPSIDDPFGIVPREFENDASILVAKIDYLRVRGQEGAWWAIAKEAHESNPEEDNLTRFAAEAVIDEACNWADENMRAPLPRDLYARVTGAAETLQALWQQRRNSELPWDDYSVSLAANLVTAFRVARQYENARDILNASLELTTDTRLAEQRLLVALEMGDMKTASSSMRELPSSRDTIFARLQVYANTDNWTEVIALSEATDTNEFGTSDRAFFESVALLARVKINDASAHTEAARALLDKYPLEVVVPIILYEAAAQRKDPVWAKQLFEEALARRETLNPASRSMLARIAEREDESERVIDLLDGFITTSTDSDDLHLLARAFVNAPIRQRAITFLEELPVAIRDTAYFIRVSGSIHFNAGSLSKAQAAFEEAIKVDRKELSAHLGLINTWLRQDRKEAAKTYLSSLELKGLSGPPVHKMRLAHLLVAFGRGEDGLSYGYEAALVSRGDLQAVQLYIGLILPDPAGVSIPQVAPEIDIDHWVRLERADGQRMEIVVEHGPDRPSLDHYSPHHSLSKAVLGSKKGETVLHSPQVGTEQSWRITEHKHKYIALLHDIMQTLSARFPEATGFYQFELKGNDLTPVLDQVKALSERDSEILTLYLRDGFPIAFASTLLGKSSVEFASRILQRGEVIRTCVGTHPEREGAIADVLSALDRGIILDTYTAWFAQLAGLIPVLTKLFKRVALPQSSIDELLDFRSQFIGHGGEPLMTLGYADGQYLREEIPHDRLKESYTTISTAIDALRSSIEIVPAAAPETRSPIESALGQVARHRVLDPLYVATSEGLLLVSEDLHLRNLGRQLYGITGGWLQVALMVAIDRRQISLSDYAKAVAEFAIQRHDHVSLNAETLCSVAALDQTDKLERFGAVTKFIGTATADVDSHVSVSWEFLKMIWTTDIPWLRKAAAAGLLLDRLTGLLARHGQLQAAYGKMLRSSARIPALNEYLHAWARGHFLELETSSK